MGYDPIFKSHKVPESSKNNLMYIVKPHEYNYLLSRLHPDVLMLGDIERLSKHQFWIIQIFLIYLCMQWWPSVTLAIILIWFDQKWSKHQFSIPDWNIPTTLKWPSRKPDVIIIKDNWFCSRWIHITFQQMKKFSTYSFKRVNPEMFEGF